MRFAVRAKLARRWFNGRRYIFSEDAAAFYPVDMVDTKDVSLDFVLNYKGAAKKLEKLIKKDIYSENAHNFMKIKLPKPIKFTLYRICKPAKQPSLSQ